MKVSKDIPSQLEREVDCVMQVQANASACVVRPKNKAECTVQSEANADLCTLHSNSIENLKFANTAPLQQPQPSPWKDSD